MISTLKFYTQPKYHSSVKRNKYFFSSAMTQEMCVCHILPLKNLGANIHIGNRTQERVICWIKWALRLARTSLCKEVWEDGIIANLIAKSGEESILAENIFSVTNSITYKLDLSVYKKEISHWPCLYLLQFFKVILPSKWHIFSDLELNLLNSNFWFCSE